MILWKKIKKILIFFFEITLKQTQTTKVKELFYYLLNKTKRKKLQEIDFYLTKIITTKQKI